MRTVNAIRSSFFSIIQYSVNIIGSFISQAIFIRILGSEYLGLNGLFSNILTMLSIFELGIGSAIVYSLYSPIANNNVEVIKSIMKFYKKCYHIIAIVILSVGLLLIPFLNIIVGELTIEINIIVIYLLFLGGTVSSYILVYKRNLIYANQKNYIMDIVHIFYIIVLNISQLVVLFFTRSYYLFLTIKIIMQIIENIVLNNISNKMYPILLEKEVKPINKEIEKNIISKVKALFFHKVGSVFVLGTDNIIISSFLGVITVGIYSNYSLIVNSISTMFSKALTSITASIGNLTITENEKKIYEVFRRIRFINFWIATFTGCSLLLMIEPFVKIWVGEAYVLPKTTLVVIIINFYQKMMRNSYSTFKDSMGIWEEDKFIPLIEAGLNIFFSILFLKFFGITGVIMGTIISGLVLWIYSYPKFVYKKIFKRKYYNYAKETLAYFILFIIISSLSFIIYSNINFKNNFIQLIVAAAISILLPNIMIIIVFLKNDNLNYFLNLLKGYSNKFIEIKVSNNN